MADVTGVSEYLVSFGNAGEFSRFQAAGPMDCRRGDRVVIRTARGLEVGTVLCPATSRHARMLHEAPAGDLLRVANPEDEAIAAGVQDRAACLFDDGRRLAAELGLSLEILDVEVSLDGHQVTLYFLRGAACDERPLVSALSKKYEALVSLRDVGLPAGASGCGRPDCGSKDGGGCSTCGTGGCSTCGSKSMARDVQEYFAGLRQQMESHHRRVPLA
jgi:cell fate regulator YaaT (PSP1 superfamily)